MISFSYKSTISHVPISFPSVVHHHPQQRTFTLLPVLHQRRTERTEMRSQATQYTTLRPWKDVPRMVGWWHSRLPHFPVFLHAPPVSCDPSQWANNASLVVINTSIHVNRLGGATGGEYRGTRWRGGRSSGWCGNATCLWPDYRMQKCILCENTSAVRFRKSIALFHSLNLKTCCDRTASSFIFRAYVTQYWQRSQQKLEPSQLSRYTDQTTAWKTEETLSRRGKSFVSSLKRRGRLWGLPILLLTIY